MKQSVYQLKKREEQKKKALAFYKEGFTYREVATLVNMSRTWVWCAVRDMTIKDGQVYLKEELKRLADKNN